MTVDLPDGTYRVLKVFPNNIVCAGFDVQNGIIVACAPILRNRFEYWVQFAERIDCDD